MLSLDCGVILKHDNSLDDVEKCFRENILRWEVEQVRRDLLLLSQELTERGF